MIPQIGLRSYDNKKRDPAKAKTFLVSLFLVLFYYCLLQETLFLSIDHGPFMIL